MNDSYVSYKLFPWEVKILTGKKDKKKDEEGDKEGDEEKDENENKKEDPLLIWTKWTRVLMRVALQLDGFVASRSADGTYVVEDVDNIKKEQHAERVKDISKKEVFDDWEDQHDRLFADAAKLVKKSTFI
jgi:DNA gyrase/topoisomerase IV subunit A